ncbi:SMC-Scp complex subunit ScpB [Pseudohalioglobus sediminis]|uniref:SMC-Scp complex subunit ScpB n=1 Tax=Pseudohalioglobus sediminis TaxID=2606449 RepID=A0A5B0WZK4_9GAMM|nr:SMC-Scp complex subunit ScpB [Pseudohalioglobus sediminis]KAA1192446.1 SMC-Scp complex subunit ScpB [Pseudohalioglobus sediminis]
MSDTGLVQILEGALLAAGKPLTVVQMAELFEEHERPENAQIREALQEVAERCEGRGFELTEVASGFRFQVRQSLSPWVARLWQERPAKYSRALLETLALIAYRQPITRGEIEEIRGVAVSSNIIKTLHEREWIRVVGHRDVPGRPAMYATTRQFLDYFNLKNLDQLPALAEIRDLETLNAELGFSEPLAEEQKAGDAAAGENASPELTVVGGIDHKPETVAAESEGGEPAAGGEDDTAGPVETSGQLEPETASDLAAAVDSMQGSSDQAADMPPTVTDGADAGDGEAINPAKPENQA